MEDLISFALKNAEQLGPTIGLFVLVFAYVARWQAKLVDRIVASNERLEASYEKLEVSYKQFESAVKDVAEVLHKMQVDYAAHYAADDKVQTEIARELRDVAIRLERLSK